ncbi:uncharacterized protein GWK60_L04873 [Nakaseomyces glabratus]|nr:tRNA synthetase class II core domain (G, H, P, S and T) [Nakaseomyces glabratus]QNG16166.1 uncharacterized protein GWK60_L04873 [Nakaseomyces glabratus]
MLKFAVFSRGMANRALLPRKVDIQSLKDIPTLDVLQNLGFIRRTQSGLFNWLPLGLRTLHKLEALVRKRMDEDASAIEVSLSSLSPKINWEKTGRWDKSNELFKVKDNNAFEYCLTPTCEEDITSLMKNYIKSYKDLPITAYQISRKYRDEKRPRGGLLRGREFIMKDAYSFASSEEQAIEIFNKMDSVYDKIFSDLKIPYKAAYADSGEIGGDLSKEYHFLNSFGEDTVFSCDSCGTSSTIEKCNSLPEEDGMCSGDVGVVYGLSEDHTTLVCFYYPAERQFNWNLAQSVMENDLDMALKDVGNDKILEMYQSENEDYMFSKILRVMDVRINSRSNFPDFPLSKYLKNNFGQIDGISIVDATDKEICGKCEDGTLHASNSIEVGHIFHLGDKYSKPFEVNFKDENNSDDSIVSMGCYGIGISRLIGAAAEIGRDHMGLRWPQVIAPYQVSVVTSNNEGMVAINDMKKSLMKNLDTFDLDDLHRSTGFGGRIALSHAIGIPICVIIGTKSWPNVEIEVRGKKWDKGDDTPIEKKSVHYSDVIDTVNELLLDL